MCRDSMWQAMRSAICTSRLSPQPKERKLESRLMMRLLYEDHCLQIAHRPHAVRPGCNISIGFACQCVAIDLDHSCAGCNIAIEWCHHSYSECIIQFDQK